MSSITTPGDFTRQALQSVVPSAQHDCQFEGGGPEVQLLLAQKQEEAVPCAISKGHWIFHAFVCPLPNIMPDA